MASRSNQTASPAVTRILIADDHDRLRQALRHLIDTYAGLRVIGEATNGADAVRLAGELRPDVVLLDCHMPMMDGTEAARAISQQLPGTAIIGMSIHRETERIMRQAGACRHIDKAELATDLYPAVRDALAARSFGDHGLGEGECHRDSSPA